MTDVAWSPIATDGKARTGVLRTAHGEITTPAFMPVATRGAVKALDSSDLVALGAEMLLANTYHLMLRPGAELISRRAGLHVFMGWERPLLTDSGGYQVFSLGADVDQGGARLRSVYDGSEVHLTPENVVRTQEQFGSDIAMVLDVCIGLPADPATVKRATDLTHDWAERSLVVHTRADQALFGIVQGGIDPDLRQESARRIAAMGFSGFGIGGLSVGESPSQRDLALEAALAHLPADRVRYVMGLGDAAGVLAAIEVGADLFDCVWPTRLARHGRVFSSAGDFNLRRAQFAEDQRPLSDDCPCPTCGRHSRAFLRHLLMLDELTVFRLLTIHNLTYTLRLLAEARRAIADARFGEFRTATLRGRARSDSQPG